MRHSELIRYREQFEGAKVQARELTAGLSEAEFNWRPSPEAWSIEECLEHLRLTGEVSLSAIEKALDREGAAGRTAEGPFEYGPIDRLILRLSEPPVKMRFRAPKHFQPLHGQPVTAVLPTFCHVQDRFVRQLERADGLDLAKVKVATPVSRFLRMSLGAMLGVAAAHERRHLEQARNVRMQLRGR